MSILKTIFKPVKAFENEFEALVHKTYQKYNEKTGKDQYSLSNFYADGAFIYHNAAIYCITGFSELSLLHAGLYGFLTYDIHKRNKEARSIDESIADSPELVRHPKRERIRWSMKLFGRCCLFVGMNWLSEKYIGYSVFDLLPSPDTEFNITDFDIADMCGFLEISLYTLCGYTSAMDLNNPKKSKILSKAKDMLAGYTKRAYSNQKM